MKRIPGIFILLIILIVVPNYPLLAEEGKKSPPLPSYMASRDMAESQ